jgi:hypothetical protein
MHEQLVISLRDGLLVAYGASGQRHPRMCHERGRVAAQTDVKERLIAVLSKHGVEHNGACEAAVRPRAATVREPPVRACDEREWRRTAMWRAWETIAERERPAEWQNAECGRQERDDRQRLQTFAEALAFRDSLAGRTCRHCARSSTWRSSTRPSASNSSSSWTTAAFASL